MWSAIPSESQGIFGRAKWVLIEWWKVGRWRIDWIVRGNECLLGGLSIVCLWFVYGLSMVCLQFVYILFTQFVYSLVYDALLVSFNVIVLYTSFGWLLFPPPNQSPQWHWLLNKQLHGEAPHITHLRGNLIGSGTWRWQECNISEHWRQTFTSHRTKERGLLGSKPKCLKSRER